MQKWMLPISPSPNEQTSQSHERLVRSAESTSTLENAAIVIYFCHSLVRCDVIDSVNIDECYGCRIFIGPVSGSIFIRNSKDCNVIVACQQFRTRECDNMNFGLYCSTRPIIETSTNMLFGCFEFFYFSLKEQMNRAHLVPWNNKWSCIHDFSPNKACPNWGLLQQSKVSSLVEKKKCESIVHGELAVFDRQWVIPVTIGCRERSVDESIVVVFWPSSNLLINEFMTEAQTREWRFVNTRAMALDVDRRRVFFSFNRSVLKQFKKDALPIFTVLELYGNGIMNQVNSLLASPRWPKSQVQSIPEQHSRSCAKYFFEADEKV